MKLDLINSRFGVTSGPRIYDSIEGDFIQHAKPGPKAISKAAFKNKQKRLDFEPKKEFVPDRFNVSVVDRCGNYIPADKTKRFRPKQSLPRTTLSSSTDNTKDLIPPKDPFLLDTYPSLIVDYKKDHIYLVKEDTVQNRLASGRLPGAAWDVCGRKNSPPASKLGPGDYDVYDSDLTNKGRMKLRGGQFTTDLAREEDFDPDFLPLKERQRYQRVKTLQEAKQERTGRALSPLRLNNESVGSLDHTAGSIGAGSTTDGPALRTSKSMPHIGGGTLGGYGKKDRFDDLLYKQESFVKTSGMTLSGDWDKHLVKKIPFSFQPPAHTGKKSLRKPDAHKSEGADVDVDVGHMFSIVHTAAKSPVKYSAAFRSSAKVGMEIPVPTSGVNIGPGSFPGAHATSLVVVQPDRPSHFILRGRPQHVRRPVPDLTEPVLPFAERHKSGPIFDKHVISGGNVVLAAIVKERMTKIYPKLAEKKFPDPPPIVVPSPWKTVKRK